MKVLKVSEMNQAIESIILKKKVEKKQLFAIRNAMKKVIGLEDALKGKGGNAIRENFLILHIPTLLLFEEFLDRYIEELQRIIDIVGQYESQTGLVREDFIEQDVTRGLIKAEQTTHSIVQNINAHLSSVDDLVEASPLSTRSFDIHISDAKAHLRKMIEDLNQFDHNSTSKLKPSSEKLRDIHQFSEKIKNCTKNGIALSETEAGEAGKALSGDTLRKMIEEYGLVMLFRNTAVSFGSAIMNSGKLLQIGNLRFKMFRENGNILIKIKGEELKSLRDYERYRKLLVESLGGKWKWDRKLVTELVNGGISLYDEKSILRMRNNSNKFINSQFSDLGNYVKRLDQPFHEVAGKTFKDEMKIWGSFIGWKEASTLTKLGKGAGALGIGLTVYDDAVGNFYNSKTGKWEYTGGKQIQKFAVDTTVDLATGAGAMAAGAAAGSFFLPPAGTVVGAVVGAGIFAGANLKFIGNPPESIVDATKSIANKTVYKVGGCIESVGKTLGKIFW
ncbi:LXG domain-containing protein [Bacillus marasmi]|uniref:LXG domain-containing protein n=1 Tax=Bacillus marasmi TaxID=1926279 RepID=UPI00164E1684|nr:LXG domain-containing protein [Bacillus marasmi]